MTPDAATHRTARDRARSAPEHGSARSAQARPSIGDVLVRALRVATVTLAAAALAAGCGLRVETAPPSEPVPDAEEVIRNAAVTDALAIEAAALSATTSAGQDGGEDTGEAEEGDADDLAAALGQVAAFAALHAEQLGGPYDSGLPEPGQSGSPTPDPSPSAPPAADGPDVALLLAEASLRLRASADATTDGPLARLLLSVSASQHVSAQHLATLVDVDLPTSEAEPVPPDAAPGGLSAAELSTVVVAEDAAAYAYEVRAASSEGSVRERAVDLAATHRQRAEGWAQAAGITGTGQDPRRVAYTVPDDPTRELATTLEGSLAQTYASLAASATAGTRTQVAELFVDTVTTQVGWGGERLAFPGLPEQQ
ncbi:DUF4439 domain-containing protein [Oerskovia flava]|uniref:DUF4439 domain-containing protein n=1 Tax=Oerskovia flava TaxID=2986422 RepID=UPI00223F7AA6|nr:DUF4439 domain-containing protein [Oerskovia sp. JB1-3-2]